MAYRNLKPVNDNNDESLASRIAGYAAAAAIVGGGLATAFVLFDLIFFDFYQETILPELSEWRVH